MAANRIKGIILEIGGETTKLDKALAGTNKEIKNTAEQLKDVERLLKLDPKNTELLRQKQELLSRSVEQTRDKLDTLRDAAEKADEALARGQAYEEKIAPLREEAQRTSEALAALQQAELDLVESYKAGEVPVSDFIEQQDKLQAEIDQTEQHLSGVNDEIKATNEAFKGTKISTDQYDALQRELAATEREFQDAEEAAKDFSSGVADFSRKVKGFADGADKVASATRGVSAAATGVLGALAATVPATDEYRASLSMLKNNAEEAGVGMDTVRASFERCVVATNEVDSSVEAVSNLLQCGFTESDLQEAVENLTGAYLRFPDTMKIESLADSLQETLAQGEATGQFAELLERCGMDLDVFNDQLAQCPGLANKQNYVLNQLAHQGLADTYKGWVENNEALVNSRTATLDMKDATAELAEKIEPITTKLVEMATDIVRWFSSLDTDAQTAIMGVLAAFALLSPVASTISNVTNMVSGLTAMFGKLDIKTVGVVVAFGALVGLTAAVAEAWEDMSTLQKVVAVLGALTAAALTAAVAMGAFHSASSMGAAAIGIAAGIAAVTAAVMAAKQEAEKASQDAQKMQLAASYPHFRYGGVAGQNRPFMAVVGDNPNEPEVIAPYSMIRQAASDAIAENGGSGGRHTTVVRFEGSLAQLGRLLAPHIEDAQDNRGGSMRGK